MLLSIDFSLQVTTIVIRIGLVQLRGSKGLALAHIAWRPSNITEAKKKLPKNACFQSGLHIHKENSSIYV